MILILILPFVLSLAAAPASAAVAHYRYSKGYRLADPRITPGAVTALTEVQVCATKWGKDERQVANAMKVRACALYGAKNCPRRGVWEVDHLIPRELGGADAIENLFPQPIGQARLKDRLENRLHLEVCAGKLALAAAQEAIRKNWAAAYRARWKMP